MGWYTTFYPHKRGTPAEHLSELWKNIRYTLVLFYKTSIQNLKISLTSKQKSLNYNDRQYTSKYPTSSLHNCTWKAWPFAPNYVPTHTLSMVLESLKRLHNDLLLQEMLQEIQKSFLLLFPVLDIWMCVMSFSLPSPSSFYGSLIHIAHFLYIDLL